MASKLGGDNEDPIVDINITPFVDVILVVLIIFMVTTPMLVNQSIQIQLPKAVTGEDTPPTNLQLSISKDGEVYLDGKKVSEDEIEGIAKEKISFNANVQASIAADQDTTHGQVIRVIDLIKKGGIHKFSISTTK
ncbi:MAG: biopolymer transporter ExbD [Bdellovibrionales bacterium]|nr:biopolymer transporter ExbD [Bdellovibrionales bacterium]